MRKTILIFGLIIGVLLCINMVYMVNECYNNPNFESNDVAGYAVMIGIFSLIFFGIRNYRNKLTGGLITFWNAFKVGLGIILTAATLYVVVWLFYYYQVVPDFLDKYIAHVLKEASQSDSAELAAKTAEMDSFRELYKSPVMVILITYAEVLPLGIVVALLSAFFLKRNKNENAVG